MPAALRSVFVALSCGLASAVCVLAVDTQSLLRMLVLGLSPLPLFIAGLSAGVLTGVAAALVGAVTVTLALGSSAGMIDAVALVVPVAILVRVAWQPDEQGFGRDRGSVLLLWLDGLAIAGVVGLVGYFSLFGGGVPAALVSRFDVAPRAANMAARIAPGFLTALWMVVMAANGAMAEALTARFVGEREPIDIGRLSLPLWVGPLLMVTGLAGAFVRGGTLGIVCLNAAIVLVVPFAFLGLALIHALTAKRKGGPAIVAGVYVLLLGSPAFLGWRALLLFSLILAGLGSADQLIDLRNLRGLRSGMKRK